MAGLNFRRQLLLAKVETVVGTDAVPVMATDAMLVRDIGITYDVAQLERPLALPDISNPPLRPGRKTATLTFVAEVKGSGVKLTPPKFGTLLKGCGFAETVLAAGAGYDYDPVSSAFQSLTLYLYIDGLLHKVTGARGSFNIQGTAGEYALANFTFQGAFVDVVDAAFPASPVYEASLPIVVQNAALGVNGYTDCAQQFTIDVANNIAAKLCVNALDAVAGFNITARNISGSFNPEASLLATFNPFTLLKAGTQGAFTVSLGDVNNNKALITGNVQYLNVSPGNRDSALIWDIPFRFVRTNGNDEIKFKFPQV